MPLPIDLHVHTNASDGTYSPREVVRLAAERGLGAVAITDHDTVAGVSEAQDEGGVAGVEVIAGVELSCQADFGILHILGYFVEPDHPEFSEALLDLRRGREERIPRIVSKLEKLNVRVSLEQVMEQAQGGAPGRPHVANVMVKQGYANSIQDAFDRYLRKGAAAFVPKDKLPPQEAIRLILACDGVAALAHPYSLTRGNSIDLKALLSRLISYGMQGIEVYYPRHSSEETDRFLRLAREMDLAITGGTDFHGENKPAVQLGLISGRPPLPYSLLQNLRSRLR